MSTVGDAWVIEIFFWGPLMRLLLGLLATLSLGACTPPPDLLAGANPANAAAPVAPVRYTPVLAGTVVHDVVEPRPWLDSNAAMVPKRGLP